MRLEAIRPVSNPPRGKSSSKGRGRRKPAVRSLVYLVLRGVTPVRLASHPIVAGVGEAVAVFKLDARLGELLAAGVAAAPSTLIDFEADLVTYDGAFGTRKPRGRWATLQPELPITGTRGS